MRSWTVTVLVAGAAMAAGVALAQVAMPQAVAEGTAHRPIRTSLATVPLPRPKRVTRVEMMRVDFPAHEVQDRHVHPVPLVCFVAIGRFSVKLQGDAAITYEEGAVNVEPADRIVEHVANLSDRPGRLYCSFLAGPEDRVLSRYLPQDGEPAR